MPRTAPAFTAAVPSVGGAGEHVVADLYGVSPQVLRDGDRLLALLADSLVRHRFALLGRTHHKFRTGGEGVTGVFLLSESHAAFHSYPEHEYIAVDVFSCGAPSAHGVVRDLSQSLAAERTRLTTLVRPMRHPAEQCD